MEGILELPLLDKEGDGEYPAVDVKKEKFAPEDNNFAENVDHRTITIADLADSVNKHLSMYTSRSPSNVSIFKVPANLRRVNEESYNPRLVSIGPIHHGRPELQGMERYKWRFLDGYLQNISISVKEVATIARDMENKVRECYQESFDNLSSKEFSEMIMLDGVFLVVLLHENNLIKPNRGIIPSLTSSKYVYQNQCVTSDIIHDLMLLENQLPLFVLKKFYEYISTTSELEWTIHKFFAGNLTVAPKLVLKEENKNKHLVDFFRTYYRPMDNMHSRGKKIVYNRTATELQEAGVIIQRVPGYDIFDIKFQSDKLTIPTLRVNEYTETLLRNLIAFEQCQFEESKDITSYIIFMDSLINTAKDVDLLVKCGVIQNSLGDHEPVANLFNNLHKETLRRENDFYFEELCTELNKYSKDNWHQWKAKWFRAKNVLRHDYFNTPWSTISVIAAVILLVLTVVQTVCSIVSII